MCDTAGVHVSAFLAVLAAIFFVRGLIAIAWLKRRTNSPDSAEASDEREQVVDANYLLGNESKLLYLSLAFGVAAACALIAGL